MNKFLFLGLVLCISGLLFAQQKGYKTYDKGGSQTVYAVPAETTASPKAVCTAGFKFDDKASVFTCTQPYHRVPCNVITINKDNTGKNLVGTDFDWTKMGQDFKVVAIVRGGAPKDDRTCWLTLDPM